MQGANKPGTVTSFFTFWNGPDWSVEGWNEIDVELVPSIYDNPMSMNIIWEWQQQDQSYCGAFQPGTDWNDYVIEWMPEYIQWYINGNMVRRQENTPDVEFLTKDQVLMMNFWTPTFNGWGDDLNDAGMPWYAYYDYVKVETYNFDTSEFELHWQDDFDSLDESRWLVSDNWNFDQNTTTFMKNQVYTEDGSLVLKLDYAPTAEAMIQ